MDNLIPFSNYKDFPKATQQFFKLLGQFPFAATYWRVTEHGSAEVDLGAASDALDILSHGEATMLRFLVAVWLGDNRFDFDLFEAVRVLDADSLEAITDWMQAPCWP